MNLIQENTKFITPFVETAAQMVKYLLVEIERTFSRDIKIVSRSENTLTLSYFGYKILLRVEIQITLGEAPHQTHLKGHLFAYALDYDPSPNGLPKETLITGCEFNQDARVQVSGTQREWGLTFADFARPFLLDVFNVALRRGMTLRPAVLDAGN